MTEPMSTLEALHTLEPNALARARRLQYAVGLLSGGMKRREASGMPYRQFDCSRSTAWRLVDMAADLVLIDEATPAAPAARAGRPASAPPTRCGGHLSPGWIADGPAWGQPRSGKA